EVITAFGRTGNMFGSTTLGMKPHTISVAKAITSAYMPLGAVLIDEPMYQAMLDESRKIGTFGHGYTYSGHPVACAVAMKTLEIYERDNIVGQIQKKSPAFVARLEGLIDHPFVGEAKALGLIGGIELVADKNTRRAFDPKKGVAAKCVSFAQHEGLIVRPLGGDRIAFCPPLVISEAEIHDMFDRFERGLKRMADWITAEGLALA
ncbi:MAG: aminotransferase class III-fold pyridoxal phosphate-dependent enzyme, partial [Beijerinckiaceae bacterium]